MVRFLTAFRFTRVQVQDGPCVISITFTLEYSLIFHNNQTMKTKKTLIFIILLFCTFALFAQRNVYAGADAQTQAALENADKLVEQKQYATAFDSLSRDNEFFIAKKN